MVFLEPIMYYWDVTKKHIIEQVIRNQFVLWSVFSNVYF